MAVEHTDPSRGDVYLIEIAPHEAAKSEKQDPA